MGNSLPVKPKHTAKVGSFTYANTSTKRYYIEDIAYTITKHPGVPHDSPGLWKVLPHDVVSIKDYNKGILIQTIPFFRFQHMSNPQSYIFVKVRFDYKSYYEYDKLDVVDFTKEDWDVLFD